MSAWTTQDKINFIQTIYPAALKVSQETGLSVELMLAQAALETGYGKGVPPNSNNIYGIKAGLGWTGPFVYTSTRENFSDQITDKFRVYESIEASIRDRASFLLSNSRYQHLFDSGTLGNYSKEALVLQNAGYATDKNSSGELVYAAKLITIVESGSIIPIALKTIAPQTKSEYGRDLNGTFIPSSIGTKTTDVKDANNQVIGQTTITIKADGSVISNTRLNDNTQYNFTLDTTGRVNSTTIIHIDETTHAVKTTDYYTFDPKTGNYASWTLDANHNLVEGSLSSSVSTNPATWFATYDAVNGQRTDWKVTNQGLNSELINTDGSKTYGSYDIYGRWAGYTIDKNGKLISGSSTAGSFDTTSVTVST